MEFLKVFFLLISVNAHSFELDRVSFFLMNKNCKYKKNYIYLTKEKSRKLNLERIIRKYNIKCENENLIGFILSDQIRTHYQTLFVVLTESHMIKSVEVLKFSEPLEYRAPEKWVQHMFVNKKIKISKVDALSGATLTTQSFKRVMNKVENVLNL